MLSEILIVGAAAIFSMALRSYQNRLIHRLGTIMVFVTSFLAGWLLGGHLLIGVAFASTWLFLPWLEILTRVRKMRLPIERRLSPRTPPPPSTFPTFDELSEEIEEAKFEHVDDVGWEVDDHRQFYRLYYQPDSQTEAAICLVEQDELAFYYVSITSRTRSGEIYMTWNYPFSYGMRLIPKLRLNRCMGDQSFAELLSDHRLFLDSEAVGLDAVESQTPESMREHIENDQREQITHNIDRGLLKLDGADSFKYSVRGMFFLWVQFLRDLVRLS